jgi:succinate dehydrogenase/fumarate reductase cytochrome b subunit
MGIEISGILGLVILIADIWAIVKTFESPSSTGKKVLWIVLILLLPVFGLILWWLAGPRPQKR